MSVSAASFHSDLETLAGKESTVERTIPARLVRSLLLSAKRNGSDMEKILDGLYFPSNPLAPKMDYTTVPTRLYCKTLRRVAVYSKRHLFGLPANEREPIIGLRLMCLALLSCNNLEKAIECTSQFYQNYGHPGWRFNYERRGRDVVVTFIDSKKDTLNAFDISFLLRLWSWLSGQFIEAKKVELKESCRKDPEFYGMLFQCNVGFSQRINRVRFDACYLNRRIVQTEESLSKLLKEAPYELLTIRRSSNDSILSRIRFIIGTNFKNGFPSREKISKLLHISPSSLSRRLAEEGTSYQIVKDELRKSAAIHYLSNPDLSVAEIAVLMGFEDPSAFNRTFKRWTGMPPGLYRNRSLNTISKYRPEQKIKTQNVIAYSRAS